MEIISSADRIMIFIISIPIAFLTVFGRNFFELWVGRTQNARELYIPVSYTHLDVYKRQGHGIQG